jgi:hypothetical protein
MLLNANLGALSNVNHTLYHPYHSCIFTCGCLWLIVTARPLNLLSFAGVEKAVRVFSPFESNLGSVVEQHTVPRRQRLNDLRQELVRTYRNRTQTLSHLLSRRFAIVQNTTDEDATVLAMFDLLVSHIFVRLVSLYS